MLICGGNLLILPKVVHTKTYRQMIGLYIRKLREERGYLIRQMAALLDIDPTILSKMERGERPFKKENIIKVAEVCNFDKEELLTMWLADKIYDVVKDEDVALEAIELAKKHKKQNDKE